ncbi:MAG: DNA primase [Enterobacterales bacterium]|nr:DNA primase [Enterobacterales bacterium]
MSGFIPRTFVNELLARVDIVDVIERRLALKKTGKNYSACCPFHNEKTPSFSVSPDKQFFHCFGCGISGNAVGFIMEYDGQGFVESVETLAQDMGIEVVYEENQAPKQDPIKHLFPVMQQVSNYYQQQLKSNPQAKIAVEYLKKRGLSGQIAKQYGIGYAPDGWQNLIQLSIPSEDLEKDLIDSGMLIKNDKGRVYDRFRDRIMFPIRNRRGQTIGFGGRIIDQGEPKYLNSPETRLFHKGSELYGLYEMRQQRQKIEKILVVEGYMDVVALAQFGIQNAAATLGTATSSEHLNSLFRICPTIVLCFDGDKAGKKAAIRAIENALSLLKDTREIRIMFLPDGEDPDSMVRKIGTDAFNQGVNEAITLFDFLIQHLTSQVDMNTFEGPAKLVHLALPFSRAIVDPILKTRFDHQLSLLSGVSEQQIQSILQKDQPAQQPAISKAPVPTRHSPQSNNVAHKSISPDRNKETTKQKGPFRRAICLLLQNPEALPAANLDWVKSLDDPGAKIFSKLCQLILQNEAVTTGMLIENWRDQPEETALKRLANQDLLLNDEQIAAELPDLLAQLEKSLLLEQWDNLIAKSKLQPLSAQEKQQLKSLQSQIATRG